MPEEEAFCVFVKLMQDYRMREIFKPTMAELGLCIFQLESFLQVHFRKRRQHFVLFFCMHIHSLRKQPMFCNAITGPTINEMTWEILMSKEFPYWWCVTTQIWVVLLIGCTTWEICFSQSVWNDHVLSVGNFFACFSEAILQGNQWLHCVMSDASNINRQ